MERTRFQPGTSLPTEDGRRQTRPYGAIGFVTLAGRRQDTRNACNSKLVEARRQRKLPRFCR